MARLPPHVLGGRVPLAGVIPASPAVLEQKIATQHAEIQALLSENQRLASTHVALRQELATTQMELQRIQQAFALVQADKEQQVRAFTEQLTKLDAEVRAIEPLKAELENAKAGAHKLLASRQELNNQVAQLTKELLAVRSEASQTSTFKAEVEGLRQEVHRARTAFEVEKKANTDLLEHRGAMEKNLVSMAREVEKLRAELANAEKVGRVGSYGGAYGATDPGYSSASLYGDTYGLSQIPLGAEKGLPYGSSGSAGAWGAYGAHLRR